MEGYRRQGDRTVNSTDNNEFATDIRDETMLEDDLVDEKPLDDYIPESINELGEKRRPIYNEMGMDEDQI